MLSLFELAIEYRVLVNGLVAFMLEAMWSIYRYAKRLYKMVILCKSSFWLPGTKYAMERLDWAVSLRAYGF